MQQELKRRGTKGDDFAALCRRNAWLTEREAKQTEDPKRKAVLMELVAEMRKWADEEDAGALEGAQPVPLVDRAGMDR